MQQIHSPEAHAITGGSPAVLVGDIDTGIDFNHPDLKANIDVADSVNCVSGVPVQGTAAQDDIGHGTHTAGTIAAASNGFGIVGVAPNVHIAAICFSTLSADGFGAAPVAAVALPTVARATDEKDATAPRPATKPLTKNDFGGVRHPFRRRNWTTAAQLWQATHCCCRRALRSSRPGPDRHQRSGPFRFSAFKRPHYQTGN